MRRRWVDETFDLHVNCHRSVAVLEICAIEDVRGVVQMCFRTLRAKHFIGRHLRFRFSIATRHSFLGFFHSSVMSEIESAVR